MRASLCHYHTDVCIQLLVDILPWDIKCLSGTTGRISGIVEGRFETVISISKLNVFLLFRTIYSQYHGNILFRGMSHLFTVPSYVEISCVWMVAVLGP